MKWATERGNLEAYECVDLDKTLSQFYAEVCKESSEDYEPDSLRVMQAALERHLKSNLTRNLLSKIESSSVQEKSWRGKCES